MSLRRTRASSRNVGKIIKFLPSQVVKKREPFIIFIIIEQINYCYCWLDGNFREAEEPEKEEEVTPEEEEPREMTLEEYKQKRTAVSQLSYSTT